MCGIVCAFDLKQSGCFKTASIGNVQNYRHRGPDWSGFTVMIKRLCLMRDWQLLIQLPKQPYLVKMEN
jgi:asparagine synthetase B (glutamine-hydrolysing)